MRLIAMYREPRNSTRAWLKEHQPANSDVIMVGLVNNMPDAALEAAEQQFTRLLTASVDGPKIAMQFYALSSIIRDDAGRTHLKRNRYRDVALLRVDDIDAVIVTGAEPLHSDLRRERYWPDLAALFDWIARENLPALFSCLATHAAVLHFDGIARTRLDKKTCGMFAHDVARHPLTTGLRGALQVAHSRWNEVSPQVLETAGYQILTHSPEAGAELFVKRGSDAMLFFQGHPEYDADTLAREYRRDVRRYLAFESDKYPELPRHYFNAEEEAALNVFRDQSLAQRDENLLQDFPALNARQDNRTGGANQIAANWLRQIAGRRQQPSAPRANLRVFEQAQGL